jgi:uncharacterized protein (TIGR02391 family)
VPISTTWRSAEQGLLWTEVGPKVVAAWALLLRFDLLAIDEGEKNTFGKAALTPRGIEAAKHDDDLSRVRAEIRIEMGLHPFLEKVRDHFLRPDYEAAVLFAMRAVEIRVRELGQLDVDDVGTKLMRKAFDVGGGPLTDPAQAAAEQQATSDLFAGAMGMFKNPSSHRQVNFDDPSVAAEIILLADLLLRMLDAVEKRIEDYKLFIREEVGDGSDEIAWPAQR